jgi:hypothetical protein
MAFAALLTAGARTADAQALGYGVAGLGVRTGGFLGSIGGGHVAGGGELLSKGRAGIAGEVGLLGNSSSVLTTVSVGGVWHVVPMSTKHRPAPYLTSGFSVLANHDGGFATWNIGGGVDVWTGERMGIRLDVRDHLRPLRRHFGGTAHYWTVGAGVVFR